MTEWTKEELRALRGRGLSRWFGSVGEGLSSGLHAIAFVAMFATEIGMLIFGAGVILAVLGVAMSWAGKEIAIGLLASVVGWIASAIVYEGTKR